MTVRQFRQIALSLPGAVESQHMGHPDFRVNGKIFATLFSRDDVDYGMVRLNPIQQKQLTRDFPKMFYPLNGAWGRQGCTQVLLRKASRTRLREAMFTAWCNIAPKSLFRELEF